ncbi:MAG: MqnA/MqnD/SBP family protein [Thermoplasmatales archaeon]
MVNDIQSDIAFIPSPLAVLKMNQYFMLSAGAIFSYFSGPIVVNPGETFNELYVRKEDFYSRHYAKIFLKDAILKEGEGYPAVFEPRLAIMLGPFSYPKTDLYSAWSSLAESLPLPLYCGMIKRELRDVKKIVEEAIRTSVKYALNNSDLLIKDIAHLQGIKNVDMLKRVILNFVNRDTLSMAADEVEAIGILKNAIESRNIKPEDLIF